VSLNHPGVAAIGNNVYVAGGFTPDGASTRAFVLTPGAASWHDIAPLRRARGALSLLAIQGRLYAIGGRDGSVEVATPERFDPKSGVWSDLPSMPDPRNHTAGFVNAGRACVAGGRIPLTSAAIDCYDPATASWSRLTTLPEATSGAGAAFLDGVLAVAGGEPSSETTILDLVQERRGTAWSSVPMLVPRHGTAFAVFRGRLWMCGGATAPGFHAVSTCTSLSV
jgi:hypothetical protein